MTVLLPPVKEVHVPPARSASAGSLFANPLALWRGTLARISASAWATWFAITFSYYGFFTWIPSLLRRTRDEELDTRASWGAIAARTQRILDKGIREGV